MSTRECLYDQSGTEQGVIASLITTQGAGWAPPVNDSLYSAEGERIGRAMTSGSPEPDIWLWFGLPEQLRGIVSHQFVKYIYRLARTPSFGSLKAIAASVRIIVELGQSAGTTLPDPQALPSEDGTLSLAWRIGDFQFSLDVLPNGNLECFWRNRETQQGELEEVAIESFSHTAFARKFVEALSA